MITPGAALAAACVVSGFMHLHVEGAGSRVALSRAVL